MLRGIIESINYRKCSQRSKEICGGLSKEYKVKEERIYSLLRGAKAKSSTEMKVLYRMVEMGIVWRIKSSK